MSGTPALWAPRAARVELVTDAGREPMRAAEGGWWHTDTVLQPGERYAFSLDGGDPRADPRGLRLPDGPHGSSAWYDAGTLSWHDDGWTGSPLEGAVIYETHIGTFTPEGTLDAAVERLPHLVDLGVTVVELLPLASYPGRHGWGYDGVAPWSVHEAYGGPDALHRFVEAAHAAGLGVCLDLVYNHLGPDGNYLAEIGPYLDDRYVTPWGQAVNLDGPDSHEVRRWVVENALLWLRDFHVDGLRLDAVHELHDEGALPILEELSREVDALAEETGRPKWLVAESDRNDPRTVTPRGPGKVVAGLGVHGQWVDDVHHALHVALTGESQGYYSDFADPEALPKVLRSPFFHDGTWSSFRGRSHGRPVDASVPGWRFVASLQTHDQVGNRAEGERLSQLVDPGLLACGAAVLLTAPWTPMLFMGEEWAAGTPWQFFTDHTNPDIAAATAAGRKAEFGSHGWAEEDVPDPQDPATFERSRLDWSEPGRAPHARMLRWYTDLIALRREHPELRDPALGNPDVHWADRHLAVGRGPFRVLANLADRPWSVESPGEVVLAWDEVGAGEGTLVVPPRSAVVVRSA